MDYDEIINWLLDGDVSIQYQTRRDLLCEDAKDLTFLRKRIEAEGFGKRFMEQQNPNGHWGVRFYQPKWTSTHYTLLDLRNLCIMPQPSIIALLNTLLDYYIAPDGGIGSSRKSKISDICINGMFLNYASYFGAPESKVHSIVDFLCSMQMKDGGFNCWLNIGTAMHSSLHTTLSVLEGMTEYLKNGYTYRASDFQKVIPQALEFILMHRLYKSDHTGETINKAFLTPVNPPRWKYDILRALDYMRYAEIPYDQRMNNALDVISSKRKKDGRWNNYAKYPGKVHFDMETAGAPGRWNTLRALRVLNFYNKERL